MKKFLTIAFLAVIFFISAPQAEASLLYTGVQGTINYQGKNTLVKYYIDTDSVIDVKNGFSVDIVEELVGYEVRRYVPLSYVYVYKTANGLLKA